MKSRTKYDIDLKTAQTIFQKAGLGDVNKISPLGAGEFNAVYCVTLENKEYVLKIAPQNNDGILEYERDMMRAEVYWYERMRKDTDIRVPEVYFCDFSKETIPADYFIMEKIDGKEPLKENFTDGELDKIQQSMAKMAASMHAVKGEKFGYIQNGLYPDWSEAIRAMTVSLIRSAKCKRRNSRLGKKLLFYIDKYEGILKKADCSMVNFDIWTPNILVKKSGDDLLSYWIDPERCFWGDRIADFVCLECAQTLENETSSFEAYNAVSNEPVEANRETNIRYAVMMCYLALIQEVEKYFRYTPFMFGWWRNVFSGKFFFAKKGLEILKNDGKLTVYK